MTGSIRVVAPAKINLGLEILGRRPDGYHDLATIFQTIDLVDTLTLELDKSSDGVVLICDRSDLTGEENLVWRAATAFRARFGGPGVRVHLEKRIPIAAGLGGGSSDAAATLAGLAQISVAPGTADELAKIAAQLGADVAFFLRGGTALGTGRGDQIHSLPSLPPRPLVLILPAVASIEHKTARLYAALEPRDLTDGHQVKSAVADVAAGRWPTANRHYANAFTGPALSVFPGLAELSIRVERALGHPAYLTGSGPTLYSFVDDPRCAVDTLAEIGASAIMTRARTIRAGERVPARVD